MSIETGSTTDAPEVTEKVQLKEVVEDKKQSASTNEVDETLEESDTSEHSEDDAEDLDSDEESKEEKPKKRSGFKRRIDKLSKRLSEREQELEELRSRLAKNTQADQPKDQPEQKQTPSNNGRPVEDDFETYSEYLDALTDWKIDQREQKKASTEQAKAARIEFETKLESHMARVEEYKKTHPDFEELLEDVDDIPLSLTVQETILSSDVGVELMEALASNRDEFQRICNLPAIQAARELGRLEAKIVKTSESRTEAREVKKSKAPPPITPVGTRSSGKSAKAPDEMSFREYEKWREEQRNK